MRLEIASDQLIQPQALLWDYDGTLFDTDPLYREAFINGVGKNHGFVDSPELSYGRAYRAWMNTLDTASQEAIVALMRTENRVTRHELLKTKLADGSFTLYPDVRSFLSKVFPEFTPMMIVTDAVRENIETALSECPDLTSFRGYVSRDDCPDDRKPSGVPYLKAADQLGVAIENCLAFEDSNTGLTSALNAGMGDIIALDRQGKGFDSDLLQPHVHVVKSLDEVTVLD